MRVAFINRSTLLKVPGGDTIQVLQTARSLRELGVEVDLFSTLDRIDYSRYSLLHFFNITRPSDILAHVQQSRKPFVLSPILIDYSEYDKRHRNGLAGALLRQFSPDTNEYLKTMSRWVRGADCLRSKSYLWLGQRKSIRSILQKASLLLPNSEKEYDSLRDTYNISRPYAVVRNGVDNNMFQQDPSAQKNNRLVVCAARIEGLKNQLNLIRAINDSDYTLLIIGNSAPNQQGYYQQCRKIAKGNIMFEPQLPQEKLVDYFQQAKVHALPSWFETCGLSSLEAGAMGCNLAITERGYTREYFGDAAFYADPGSVESIYEAVDRAANADCRYELQQKIINQYTWRQAARLTASAYDQITRN